MSEQRRRMRQAYVQQSRCRQREIAARNEASQNACAKCPPVRLLSCRSSAASPRRACVPKPRARTAAQRVVMRGTCAAGSEVITAQRRRAYRWQVKQMRYTRRGAAAGRRKQRAVRSVVARDLCRPAYSRYAAARARYMLMRGRDRYRRCQRAGLCTAPSPAREAYAPHGKVYRGREVERIVGVLRRILMSARQAMSRREEVRGSEVAGGM